MGYLVIQARSLQLSMVTQSELKIFYTLELMGKTYGLKISSAMPYITFHSIVGF
jgi:hypothetical protein